MEVKQIAQILNETIIPEIKGESDISIAEDFSNVVEVGKNISAFLSAGNNVDNAVKAVLNKVGKTINWNRPYIGMSPNILRESWEYGSILEKNRTALSDYSENPTYKLENGVDYLDGKYYAPSVSSKLFNKSTTFEIDTSFAEKQFRESVTSASGVSSFFGMIESRMKDSLTFALDGLTMRTIDNFALEHFKAGKGVINVLSLYNTTYGTSLTKEEAATNAAFLRYLAYITMLYKSRMRGMTTQFNIDSFETHTPYERQMLILHSDYAKGADIYLQSDTYHNELTSLGEYRDVPFWQSSKDFSYGNTTTIQGAPASGEWVESGVTYDAVSCGGVIGMLIDRDACAICREEIRTTTQFVPRAEFFTNFTKQSCLYLNDLAENGIIFTLENPVKHVKENEAKRKK